MKHIGRVDILLIQAFSLLQLVNISRLILFYKELTNSSLFNCDDYFKI